VALPAALEPRLRAALEVIGQRYLRARFGYFRGNLYIAVTPVPASSLSALSRFGQSFGAHLVTIESREENAFVYGLFEGDDSFFRHASDGSVHGPAIGLYQADRSREPRGGWAWVTGEPVRFANWSQGNPDNFRGAQNYASFYRKAETPNARIDSWDDVSGVGYLPGAIFEVEGR
jgi:hypothetical protein